MMQLILSFIAITLFLVISIVLIVRKRYRKDGRELAIVSEIPETMVFGCMLVIVGYALLLAKYYNPSVAGNDLSSYNFVAILAAICGISGSQILLSTFVKKAVAYPDRFVVITMFGFKREFSWRSVTEVKTTPISLRVTFTVSNESVSINGRGKEYGEFIRTAREKIPATVGSDVLGRLYNRITKPGIIKL
ncbi:MAG: hypothetical protein GX227_05490 [Clostridiaceae bacterium]|jgi:hypothetical protein|nr:hypothetical protein [Clostridiaceae bacterium]